MKLLTILMPFKYKRFFPYCVFEATLLFCLVVPLKVMT